MQVSSRAYTHWKGPIFLGMPRCAMPSGSLFKEFVPFVTMNRSMLGGFRVSGEDDSRGHYGLRFVEDIFLIIFDAAMAMRLSLIVTKIGEEAFFSCSWPMSPSLTQFPISGIKPFQSAARWQRSPSLRTFAVCLVLLASLGLMGWKAILAEAVSCQESNCNRFLNGWACPRRWRSSHHGVSAEPIWRKQNTCGDGSKANAGLPGPLCGERGGCAFRQACHVSHPVGTRASQSHKKAPAVI